MSPIAIFYLLIKDLYKKPDDDRHRPKHVTSKRNLKKCDIARVCIYVYVCMYVCMYIYIYIYCIVCTYICMYCVYVCMYVRMYITEHKGVDTTKLFLSHVLIMSIIRHYVISSRWRNSFLRNLLNKTNSHPHRITSTKCRKTQLFPLMISP